MQLSSPYPVEVMAQGPAIESMDTPEAFAFASKRHATPKLLRVPTAIYPYTPAQAAFLGLSWPPAEPPQRLERPYYEQARP